MVSYLGVVRTVMMADTSQFNMAMRNASSEFRTAALNMQRSARGLIGVGGALNLAITAPLLLATRAVVKFGAEYESAMLKVKQVSEMSNRDFQQFAKDQLALSKEMKTRPSDLAKIAYMGAQAQITDPKRLKEFQKAVTMAQTIAPGDASVETVASALARNVNAFNRAGDQIIDTVAQMKFATDKGQISWHEYSSTIGQVVAQAADIPVGDRFKDMNMAIALATHSKVPGALAATALRNLYLRIYKEGAKGRSELNQAAKSAGFSGIIDMYERGFKGNITAMMQAFGRAGYGTPGATAALGFGTRESSFALSLMNVSTEKVQTFSDAYDNATTSFIQKFSEAQNSTTKSMEALAGAMERLKIAFFDTFGSSLTDIINRFADFITKLAELPESSKKMLALVVGLGALGAVLTGLVGVVQSIMLFARLRGIENAMGTAMGGLAGGAAPLLGTVVGASGIPATAVGASLAGGRARLGVGRGVAGLLPQFASLKSSGGHAFEKTINPKTGETMWRMLSGATMPAGFTSKFAPSGISNAKLAGGGRGFSMGLGGLGSLAAGILPLFSRIFAGIGAALKGGFAGIMKGLVPLLGKLAALGMIFLKVVVVATLVTGLFKAIRRAFAALPLDGFKDWLKSLGVTFSGLRDLFGDVTDVIADVLTPAIIHLFGWIVDAVSLLVKATKKAGLGVTEFFMHVKHGFGRAWDELTEDDARVKAFIEAQRIAEYDSIRNAQEAVDLLRSWKAVIGAGEGFRTNWWANYKKKQEQAAKDAADTSTKSTSEEKGGGSFAKILRQVVAGSSGFFEARTAAGYAAQMQGRDGVLSALERLVEAAQRAEQQRNEMLAAESAGAPGFTKEFGL